MGFWKKTEFKQDTWDGQKDAGGVFTVVAELKGDFMADLCPAHPRTLRAVERLLRAPGMKDALRALADARYGKDDVLFVHACNMGAPGSGKTWLKDAPRFERRRFAKKRDAAAEKAALEKLDEFAASEQWKGVMRDDGAAPRPVQAPPPEKKTRELRITLSPDALVYAVFACAAAAAFALGFERAGWILLSPVVGTPLRAAAMRLFRLG